MKFNHLYELQILSFVSHDEFRHCCDQPWVGRLLSIISVTTIDSIWLLSVDRGCYTDADW